MNAQLTNSHGWPVHMNQKETRKIDFSGILLVHLSPDCDGGLEIDRLSNIWIEVGGKSFHLSLLQDEKGNDLNNIILGEAGAAILAETGNSTEQTNMEV